MTAPARSRTALVAVSWPVRAPAGLTIGDAVRRLAHRDRVTAWSGRWSAGDLVTCDPVRTAAEAEELVVPEVADPGIAAAGGGWFGYLSFPSRDTPFPRISFAWYPDLLRRSATGSWTYEALLGPDLDEEAARARLAALTADLQAPSVVAAARLEVLGAPDRTAHVVAVEECIRAIRRGEVYQANIATHLDLRLHGSPHDAFGRLVAAHAPARAALVADPAGTAVSASPELFLSRTGRTVRTAPIKGTRPRTGAADERERARLAASAKDAAENVMIVDLMRNDLSRVCATGTVRVPRLLAVEPHAGVWHLVSEVTGELAPGRTDADLLRATFPPGSVTGAPKIRAVELIEELEAAPRGLFTGAMGYVSPLAGLELSVAIRTLEVAPDGTVRLGVGGGVTVDSSPVEEWRECLTKAAPLLTTLGAAALGEPVSVGRAPALFETILAVDGRPRRLADHVGRLRRSWFELTGAPLEPDVAALVTAAVAGTTGARRIRVDVRPGADPEITAVPFEPEPLDRQPGLVLRVRRTGEWRRHKLAARGWLDAHEAAVGPGETPLLVDAAGLVLEGTRSSVFALVDGVPLTPPLDGRVLPGTTRTAVLDVDRQARPAVLPLDVLARAEGAFLTNALRGVQWVRELRAEDGTPLATWAHPHPRAVALAAALADDHR